MPRTIPLALQTHLQGDKLTTCMVWRVTRRDGQVFGFTDHDRNLTYAGRTYLAVNTASGADLQATAGTSAENTEISTPTEAQITEQQIAAGVWNLATVEAELINWTDPAAGGVVLQAAEIGEIRVEGGRVVVELRGFKHRLAQPVGRVVQAACDAVLGDTRCGVNLVPLTVAGTVTAVTDLANFTDSARGEAAGWFTGGVVTWTTGANAGARMEIKRHQAGGVFELFLPMTYAIAVGDAYSMTPGSDHTFATCVAKFGNGNNYRGFPFVPGSASLRAGGSAG